MVRSCLECGTEFDPGKTRRRYCKDECYNRRNNQRKPKIDTLTDKVIQHLGSRHCTNCRSETDGPRWAFWWDDWDRADRVMELAMLLCYPCRYRFNKVKATQDARILRYELAADRAEGMLSL